MNDSWHAYKWVISHIWISHVKRMNESSHIFEGAMSHMTWFHHTCNKPESRMKSLIDMWHDAFTLEIAWWFLHVCDMTQPYEISLILVSDMTQAYVTWLNHTEVILRESVGTCIYMYVCICIYIHHLDKLTWAHGGRASEPHTSSATVVVCAIQLAATFSRVISSTCWSVLQCVPVRCSMLQGVAVSCSICMYIHTYVYMYMHPCRCGFSRKAERGRGGWQHMSGPDQSPHLCQ